MVLKIIWDIRSACLKSWILHKKVIFSESAEKVNLYSVTIYNNTLCCTTQLFLGGFVLVDDQFIAIEVHKQWRLTTWGTTVFPITERYYVSQYNCGMVIQVYTTFMKLFKFHFDSFLNLMCYTNDGFQLGSSGTWP